MFEIKMSLIVYGMKGSRRRRKRKRRRNRRENK
jgi:hypothetical protein